MTGKPKSIHWKTNVYLDINIVAGVGVGSFVAGGGVELPDITGPRRIQSVRQIPNETTITQSVHIILCSSMITLYCLFIIQ